MKRTITIKSEVQVTVESPVGRNGEFDNREEFENSVNENIRALKNTPLLEHIVDEITEYFDSSFETVEVTEKKLEVK